MALLTFWLHGMDEEGGVYVSPTSPPSHQRDVCARFHRARSMSASFADHVHLPIQARKHAAQNGPLGRAEGRICPPDSPAVGPTRRVHPLTHPERIFRQRCSTPPPKRADTSHRVLYSFVNADEHAERSRISVVHLGGSGSRDENGGSRAVDTTSTIPLLLLLSRIQPCRKRSASPLARRCRSLPTSPPPLQLWVSAR